jgi:hypothetical protein
MSDMKSNQSSPSSPPRFCVSYFNELKDTFPKVDAVEWDDILTWIKKPEIRSARDGKLFSPARFKASGKRLDKDVVEISLLVLDIEKGAVFDDVVKTVEALGKLAATHTTWSHRWEADGRNLEKEDRLRVILPLSSPVKPNEFQALFAWASIVFRGVDQSTRNVSRFYFRPAIHSEDAPYDYHFQEGDLLDPTNLPTLQTIDDVPLEITSDDKYGRVALEAEVQKVERSSQGDRNNTLFTAAAALAQLIAGGVLDEDEVRTRLRQAALNAGLSEKEIRSTIGSGFKKGKQQPRSIPDLEEPDTLPAAGWEPPVKFDEFPAEPFPVDCLPDAVRNHVKELSTEMQVPPDLPAMIDLTVAGAAASRFVRIKVRDNWSETTNNYSVIAMGPGNRKSQTYTRCVEPLEREQRKRQEDAQRPIAEAKANLRKLESRFEYLIKAVAKKPDPVQEAQIPQLAVEISAAKLAMPVSPRLVCDDITPERLKTMLAEQGGRIALLSSEADCFDLISGRYQNGSVNLDAFLKGWSGDTMHVDRESRTETDHRPRTVSVERPALSLCLTTQPFTFRQLGSKREFKGRGLIARLLMILPDDWVGKRTIRPKPMQAVTQETYRLAIETLSRIQYDDDNKERWLELAKDADKALEDFEREIEPLLGEDGELRWIGDWANKLCGVVCRFAGILHLLANSNTLTWPGLIDGKTMRDAIQIGRYLISHAKRVSDLMQADENTLAAKHLLRWIENHAVNSDSQQFSRREAHRGLHRRFSKVEELDPAFRLLEDNGYIRRVTTTKGSRSQVWDIHPDFQNSRKPVTTVTNTQKIDTREDSLSPLSPLFGGSQNSHQSFAGPAIWHAHDGDLDVVIEDDEPVLGTDGRSYVKCQGMLGRIPLDQVERPQQSVGSVGVSGGNI